jgi:hypothetical protein
MPEKYSVSELPLILELERLGFYKLAGVQEQKCFVRISRPQQEGKHAEEMLYCVEVFIFSNAPLPIARDNRRTVMKWWKSQLSASLVREMLFASEILSLDQSQTFMITGKGELVPGSVQPLRTVS